MVWPHGTERDGAGCAAGVPVHGGRGAADQPDRAAHRGDPPHPGGVATEANTSQSPRRPAGYDVEQKRPVRKAKSADYLIEGRIFDNYAPSTPKPRSLWRTVQANVDAGQTERVVVDLADSPVTASQLRR
ncbi:MAG: hypothetical protein CYG61_01630 [Actinobacteria bacterium]|nr:MAG: hypothetical protein CYG61_01630 [Actinomycetota bacterium]